jgi:hypothetical protein
MLDPHGATAVQTRLGQSGTFLFGKDQFDRADRVQRLWTRRRLPLEWCQAIFAVEARKRLTQGGLVLRYVS